MLKIIDACKTIKEFKEESISLIKNYILLVLFLCPNPLQFGISSLQI
jgi:hypothetical protein